MANVFHQKLCQKFTETELSVVFFGCECWYGDTSFAPFNVTAGHRA